MHTVSAALKARVDARLAECVKLTGIDVGKVTVLYDINSARLGGQAIYSTNTIRLNPVFLNAHTDHYILTTVAHEWAHLAAHKRYGSYINAHGPEWRATFAKTGSPVSRCHNYTVPAGVKVGKPKPKTELCCGRCGEDMTCGPRVAARIRAGHIYRHKACGGAVVIKASASAPAPVAAKAKAPAAPKAGSKLEQCYDLYRAWAGSSPAYDRAGMIAVFVNEADCSPAGASTYYARIKKELG